MKKFLNKHLWLKSILVSLRYKFCNCIPAYFQDIFFSNFKMNMSIAQTNVISKVHEKTFGGYKNKYCDHEIAIIATGPSLNKYIPINNVINIGVNKAIFNNKVKLDYYFAHDYLAVKPYINELINYPDVKKFYGVIPEHPYNNKFEDSYHNIMPESLILKHNASKYYLYYKTPYSPAHYNTEIDKTWLVDGSSCIFSAVQFALFTNPKKIYLIGCDCSNGYFDKKAEKITPNKRLVKMWKDLKFFAETYYPETEIISVNPVGLKGVFTDLYQEEVKID